MNIRRILRKLTDTSDGGKNLPSFSRMIKNFVSGYDHGKYWRRRAIVIDPNNKTNSLLKIYYLWWIKHKDTQYHCSFGTSYHYGSQFATPPHLPHGPYRIIVGSDAKIGEGCIIYHQVTIAGGNVVIGDKVELGAGAKILPNVQIGDHCNVGANAVVIEDMPAYSICVLQKPRIILKR